MSFELDRVIPPLPRVVQGKSVVLGSDPKGTFLLYTSGNSVILRNLKDPSASDIYTEHSTAVHVAKYSPSGFYIASADKHGKVRIWDTVNKEHVLKNEYQPFSGPICDLAWSSDNQKIIVGGTGQATFCAVFNTETGSSLGTLMGLSRNVNSVDFRPTRPFRAIAGNDEGLVTFYEGPPFTFKHSFKNHSAFVNIVRYSPTGEFFASAGADGKLFSYGGDSGDPSQEVGAPAHKGGIYGLCFSGDGSLLLTASADKSLKIWQANERAITLLSEYKFPDKKENMVLGCAWIGNTIAVVTFNTYIHLFDAPSATTGLSDPHTVLYGHSMFITCSSYSYTRNRLVTASSDGSVASWDMETCLAEMFSGQHAHTTQIQSIALIDEYLVTVGYDDRCVLATLADRSFIYSVKLPSQPRGVATVPAQMLVVIACNEHMVLLQVSNNTLIVLDEQKIELGSCNLAVSPTTGLTVVCCENHQVLAFRPTSGKIQKIQLANLPSSPLCMARFTPDGSMIAFVAENRNTSVYTIDDPQGELPTLKSAVSDYWQKHTARVTAMGWSPNGRLLATGSLDTCIVVWSLDNPSKPITIRNAHPISNSTSVWWMTDSILVSTAHDGSIRRWKITPP
ncbi:unnamed protein product [Calicophoron daubneyi]|uniref:Actin-interacting protein 1 n=1 Tax=Calicophoron daubneyi TaxID=300641 RepID=A0AAV2TBM0_CALDB